LKLVPKGKGLETRTKKLSRKKFLMMKMIDLTPPIFLKKETISSSIKTKSRSMTTDRKF
jgi:hypothetical protein